MVELKNKALYLGISEDGTRVIVRDNERGMEWELDPSTISYRRYAGKVDTLNDLPDLKRIPLGQGKAVRQGQAIRVEYLLAGGQASFVWVLGQDHLEVSLQVTAQDAVLVSLPGAFYPSQGKNELLLPVSQGILWRGTKEMPEKTYEQGGHKKWSMAMGAVVGDKGALLVTQESPADWGGTRGQSGRGPYFFFEQMRCEVHGWYERKVRIYPVDNSITAVCKKYRARVIERGEFFSWKEKISQRPMVKNLFGSLLAFIGYNKTDEIDYAASARKLKAYGFDKVFYYPVRFCQFNKKEFKMGGDTPIHLDDEVLRCIKEVPGSFIAPWGVACMALDDGDPGVQQLLRHDPQGRFVKDWKMDDLQFYQTCHSGVTQAMKKRLQGDLKEMDWVHYDVEATHPGRPCYSLKHGAHPDKPMAEGRRSKSRGRIAGVRDQRQPGGLHRGICGP